MLEGYISQACFALCVVPQVLKIYAAKTTKGVSWLTLLFQANGYFFGLAYGLHLKQLPIIIGQSWGILWSIAFLVGFLKYRGK